MTENNLNTMEQQNLPRLLGDQGDRIARLERLLGSLTLPGDRITSGTLRVKNTTDGVQVVVLDGSDVQIATIDENGLIVFDSSSIKVISMDHDGIGIYDTSGNYVGVLDHDGLRIFNGNIDVQNEFSSTTLDSKGIVSMQNFFSGASIAANNEEITSGSLVDVTGASLTTNSFSRNCQIMAFARIINYNLPADDTMSASGTFQFELQCDGQAVRGARGFNYGYDEYGTGLHSREGFLEDTLTLFSILDLGTGTHTIKVQAKTDPNTNMKAYVEEVHVGYMVLGT